MKLDYLDDFTDGGKYRDVIAINMVRLYDFDALEAKQLYNAIQITIIQRGEPLSLASLSFIQALNCNVVLSTGEEYTGIYRKEGINQFGCSLPLTEYTDMLERIALLSDGYNWLCETSEEEIDFLLSPGANGTW